MEVELVRLSTFASFPQTSQAYPIRLAEAGFTYCGFDDEVKCLDCDLHYRNWNNGDLPLEKHKQLSPNCPFVVKKFCLETSLKCEGKVTTLQQPTKVEERSMLIKSYDFHPKNKNNTDFTTKQIELFKNLGISCTKPRHPEYAILVVRITSYRNWPRHLSQSPTEMAQAGFFYTDSEDLVRCFHCGGGLTNWDKEDDPFVEHAHWFPGCIFLRQCKGDEFINHVKKMAEQQMQEDLCSQIQDHHMSSNVTKNDLIKTHATENNCNKASNTSAAIESVLEMGYSLDEVRLAIKNFKVKSGNKNYSASDILNTLLEFEEKGQPMTSSIDTIKNAPEKGSRTNEVLNMSEKEKGQTPCTNTQNSKDLKFLQEENKQLRDQTVCKVCMEESVSIVFLPCGHLATCHQCAPALKKCPLCRTFIKGTVKAFLS